MSRAAGLRTASGWDVQRHVRRRGAAGKLPPCRVRRSRGPPTLAVDVSQCLVPRCYPRLPRACLLRPRRARTWLPSPPLPMLTMLAIKGPVRLPMVCSHAAQSANAVGETRGYRRPVWVARSGCGASPWIEGAGNYSASSTLLFNFGGGPRLCGAAGYLFLRCVAPPRFEALPQWGQLQAILGAQTSGGPSARRLPTWRRPPPPLPSACAFRAAAYTGSPHQACSLYPQQLPHLVLQLHHSISSCCIAGGGGAACGTDPCQQRRLPARVLAAIHFHARLLALPTISALAAATRSARCRALAAAGARRLALCRFGRRAPHNRVWQARQAGHIGAVRLWARSVGQAVQEGDLGGRRVGDRWEGLGWGQRGSGDGAEAGAGRRGGACSTAAVLCKPRSSRAAPAKEQEGQREMACVLVVRSCTGTAGAAGTACPTSS